LKFGLSLNWSLNLNILIPSLIILNKVLSSLDIEGWNDN
jgi:hypothetical protein